jgi:hypothetical protein
MPLTLLAFHASVLMRAMLMRGFTTVCDTAGGDFGMKAASDAGLVKGPRHFRFFRISRAPLRSRQRAIGSQKQ